MARTIYFFATRSDLLPVLLEFESKKEIHYCDAGYSEIYQGEAEATATPHFQEYASAREIIGLSRTKFKSTSSSQTFLIACADTPFVPEVIRLRKQGVPYKGGVRYGRYRGGVRFAMTLDPEYNEHAIMLRPGGVYDDETLLRGEIATMNEPSPKAVELIELIRKLVRRRWSCIKPDWLGPEAKHMLDGGARLTSGVATPPLYDLRRPERPK